MDEFNETELDLSKWDYRGLGSRKDGGNPADFGTEIDIFEYLVHRGKTLLFNLHWNGYSKEFHRTAGSKYEMKDTEDRFHVVALEWTPEKYAFYVDGTQTWSTNQGTSHIQQYIILSLEVGDWAGDIPKARLPDHAFFDYVRVYQIPKKEK